MLKTVSGRLIARKRDVPNSHLPLQPPSARHHPASRPFTSTSYLLAQPQTEPLDKHDEDVQRILREYGVDPDEVGDAKQQEKRKKREKKVEDYEAWKEWDGVVDRKEEMRSAGIETGRTDVEGAMKRDMDNGISSAAKATATPLFIRPLTSSSTSGLSSSTTSSSTGSSAQLGGPSTERFQTRLNEHIKTLRAEADALRRTLSVRTEAYRIKASERAKVLEQNARVQFGMLGGRVNELTGYNEVERLKREVTERGERRAGLPRRGPCS